MDTDIAPTRKHRPPVAQVTSTIKDEITECKKAFFVIKARLAKGLKPNQAQHVQACVAHSTPAKFDSSNLGTRARSLVDGCNANKKSEIAVDTTL